MTDQSTIDILNAYEIDIIKMHHAGLITLDELTSKQMALWMCRARVAADKPAPPTFGQFMQDNLAAERMFAADQPAGDDAAVEAILWIEYGSNHADRRVSLRAVNPLAGRAGAEAIVAAVKRGEVPGVMMGDQRSYGTILSEIDKAYRAICAPDPTDPDSCDPHYIGDAVQDYIADLRAKLAEAEKVRDQSEADYTRIRADFGGRMVQERERADGAEAERDKALAELAAEREKRAIAVAACAGEKERAEKAESSLAAANAKAEEWKQWGDGWSQERDAARAELSTATMQRDCYASSRDLAEEKLERLRSRKVKLPLMYGEPDKGTPPDMAHGWKMYDDAIEACANAIRAAGVEVS